MTEMGSTEDSIGIERAWAEADATATLIASMHDATDAARAARRLLWGWPEAPLPAPLAELFLLNDELEGRILAEGHRLLPRYQELASRIAAETDRRRSQSA
jgi:hypothetical protein